MSAASELVARPPVATPFNIVRSAIVELHVTDLAAAEHFYVDLLGMVVSLRADDTLYLRGWEERTHHSVVLRQAKTAAAARISFRVAAEDDLDALAAEFERRGCPVQFVVGAEPGMGRALRTWDPFGFPLEFFYEIAVFDTQLQRFDLQRGAPILRLDHFNLHSRLVEQGVDFWLDLGFVCSEYISTDGDDERLTGAWLRRKPTVHDVAFTVGRGPRLHHVGLFVAEQVGVLRACDQLAAAGYATAIERGPGRHGVSNAFFVYLRDPDGHRVELYTCDYFTGDPGHRPLRWSASDPCCRSFWGARAPDSWYEESSPVIGPDGDLAPTRDADVDERLARSQVLA
jgi:3,4-dihydroxyphenylacetate 2,3-dioxygenase